MQDQNGNNTLGKISFRRKEDNGRELRRNFKKSEIEREV